MAEKSLNDLATLSALADSDFVILTSGGVGRKITVGELKKQFGGGSGDYNDLENLPAVTSDDEGKVLKVVGGKWTAVNA